MELDPKLQQGFFESFPGFLSICDEEHRYVYLNKNLIDALSIALGDNTILPIGLTGLEYAEHLPTYIADFIRSSYWESVKFSKSQVSVSKELSFKNSDEIRYFEVIKFKHIIDGKTYIFTNSTDITELKRDIEKYRTESLIDPLTGLYNRRAYSARANEPIKPNSFVVVIDLDNFKLVNDRFGHNEGDDVLTDFAHLLACCFRNKDFLSRSGGDEFVLVLESLTSTSTLTKRLDKLEVYFKTAFHDKYPFLGWSYGFEKIGNSLTNAFESADQQMYEYKNSKVTKMKL
ncbi:hypothetical protein BIY21_09220 [Vibrio ponticus]|uniref:diguanylate cyclase n=1 Tax=Vibrio ponticus TaxID=265668 RepID=A0ABX3FJ27_9VIBR|nr:GGDEF domain-containing protein [Vibrio ponticus]OLQ94175.1 hypothetical protein BIY21_09220 [Vibrio ponticus]